MQRIIIVNIITFITAVCAYIIGAIPTGYIIARYKGITDIRKHGSGNIGATNVSRVLGLYYFFIIFLLDAGKAFLFIHLIKPSFDINYICLFAGILLFGNGCSIFLRGTGGKGVATVAGLIIALQPIVALLLFCIWSCIMVLTHTIGIASVGAVITLPFCSYTITHNTAFSLFSLFATLWIIRTHRSNIQAYWKNN